MLSGLRTISDRLLGRGSSALTVPPLDGALRPNNRLEEAPAGIPASAPDCLALHNGKVLWSEGRTINSADGEVMTFDGPVTAVAASADGKLAIAVSGQGVSIAGQTPPALAKLDCVTALAFDDAGGLWIAIGSTVNSADQWTRDLMELRRKGRLLRYDEKAGGLSVIADGLGYPNALLWTEDGILVSEAWTMRVVRYKKSGQSTPLLSDLPGYPAGLARSTEGYWLALFAPRSPLIEFVLREPAYRRAMMRGVDPAFWVAPALQSGRSFFEPMQGGALKQMGILKPWAPTRSYGLVIEFSRDFTPIQSLHSRAGGRRHGITSVLEHNGHLWLTAKGGDEVLRLVAEGAE